jgi:hypothetical protein
MAQWQDAKAGVLDDGVTGADSFAKAGKRSVTTALQRRAKAAGTEPPYGPVAPFGPREPHDGDGVPDGDLSFVDSLVGAPVQAKGPSTSSADERHALAAEGTRGGGGSLPFLAEIQGSFGRHDVSSIVAHTDARAASATEQMGASAFATGNHVAFGGAPGLHTAAHEAAHVVQQKKGVSLAGGVGEEGDAYELHADAVADAVVAGESAEELLDAGPTGGASTALQLAPKVGKAIPAYEHKRPHKLDGTIAAATLLRRIYEKTRIDPKTAGAERAGLVMVAADDAFELARELGQIAALEKPNWSELTVELSHAIRGLGKLQTETKSVERTRVVGAVGLIEKLVGPKLMASASKDVGGADVLPAMNEQERIEMAAQAVIAVCRQTALFQKMKDGDDIAQARTLMSQVRLHYDAATDAVKGIPGHRREKIRSLNPDIKLAKEGMDKAEQFTQMGTEMPWDRAFAEGFDAERRFVDEMGLENQFPPRAYRGSVNPEDAKKELLAIAEGKSTKGGWSGKKFESPQQAVVGISVVYEEIFARQQKAIRETVNALGQPNLPKKTSMWDTLFEIFLKTALAGAAGAIGTVVQSAVKGRIEKALSTNAVNSSWTKAATGDYFEARDIMHPKLAKDAIASGAAMTTAKAEGAKDAFKEFFKTGGYKAIMAIIGSAKGDSINTNPLQVFNEQSDTVLNKARLEARMAFVHLAPALEQADPASLWELYETLKAQHDRAGAIQQDFVVQEWTNFKARLHNGAADDYAPSDNKLYHERDGQSARDKELGKPAPKDEKLGTSDAKMDSSRDEAGILTVVAWINTDDFAGPVGDPNVRSLRLPDAEDATLTQLRGGDRVLADMHMNKHFKLKITSYNNEFPFNVGVGADHGIQESTIDRREMAMLRIMMAGDRVNNTNIIVAMDGNDEKYNRFSDKELRKHLDKYLKVIMKRTRMRTLTR